MIEIGALADEKDPNALSDEIVKESVDGVFNKWKPAQTQVVNPPIPRTPSSRESIVRGRESVLASPIARTAMGTLAKGDGTSFVSSGRF